MYKSGQEQGEESQSMVALSKYIMYTKQFKQMGGAPAAVCTEATTLKAAPVGAYQPR